MGKIILTVGLAVLLILFVRSVQAFECGPITVYGTESCPACKSTKEFLETEGVDYKFVNIYASQKNWREYKRFGTNRIPVTVVGDVTIIGYNPSAIRQSCAAQL